MATCHVTQYARAARGNNRDAIPAGQEPACATPEVVTYTTATQSTVFVGNLVRLFPSAACHVAFGTNPTATATSTKIAANTAEYFGIELDRHQLRNDDRPRHRRHGRADCR